MFIHVPEAINTLDPSVLEGVVVYRRAGVDYWKTGYNLSSCIGVWYLSSRGSNFVASWDDCYVWIDLMDILGTD